MKMHCRESSHIYHQLESQADIHIICCLDKDEGEGRVLYIQRMSLSAGSRAPVFSGLFTLKVISVSRNEKVRLMAEDEDGGGDEAVKTWPSHFILMFTHAEIIDLSFVLWREDTNVASGPERRHEWSVSD